MEDLNEEGPVEFIDLEIFFRRFRLFGVRLEAQILTGWGDDNTDLGTRDVAGSVFEEVISEVSAGCEAGEVGARAGMDFDIVRKIQILQHIDCRKKNPGADDQNGEGLAEHGGVSPQNLIFVNGTSGSRRAAEESTMAKVAIAGLPGKAFTYRRGGKHKEFVVFTRSKSIG